jgi:hypothetical protein
VCSLLAPNSSIRFVLDLCVIVLPRFDLVHSGCALLSVSCGVVGIVDHCSVVAIFRKCF